MMDRANRIKEIIEYKQRRLDELADPNEWERITKNMECGEYKEFKQHCIDEEIIIAALREQEQSKWISVKDKPMPEGNEEYEVCCDYHGEKRIEIHKGWNTHCVTHWRHLPEPPKGELQ